MNFEHEQVASDISGQPYIRVQVELSGGSRFTGAMRYVDWPEDDEQLMFAQKTLSDLPSSVIDAVEEYFEDQGYDVI